jgi:hypothetical protein
LELLRAEEEIIAHRTTAVEWKIHNQAGDPFGGLRINYKQVSHEFR